MVNPPEFESSFYEKQNQQMEERYSIYFKKWKINWKSYKTYIEKSLRFNSYWMWIYWVGFEKFLQEDSAVEKGRRNRLYKDADDRIARIIGDHFKIEGYLKSL